MTATKGTSKKRPRLKRAVLFPLVILFAAGCQTGATTLVPADNTGNSQNDGTLTTGPGTTVGGGRPTDSGGNGGDIAQGGTSVTAPSIGVLEQLMLERINRARLRPAQEASRNQIAIDEGIPGQLNTVPKPALAFNATLALAARRHADDMLANDFFAHDNLNGDSPFDRIRTAGYSFASAGENLAWRGTTGPVNEVETSENMHVDLFVDAGIEGRGHRKVMLSTSFREVGISIRRGIYTSQGTNFDSLMAVQEYGTKLRSSDFFILGVVFSDLNRNGQYDFGEGIENSRVSIGDFFTNTGTGGGYVFEIPPGDYTVVFQNGASRKITLIDQNVKVDLADGVVQVNLGLGEF